MNRARDFLRDEFFTLTLLGALGRSALWSKDVHENDPVRKQFHDSLKSRLESLAAAYCSPVSDADHLANIRALADELSGRYRECFRDGRFRIGLAQKALNLYIKYLWCADLAARPPHCPVDSMVLTAAKITGVTRWTRLDSIEEYSSIIARLRDKAGDLSLAEWELAAWSEQKAKSTKPRGKQ